MLVFLIYDRRTAQLWQGFPPYPPQSDTLLSYIISGQSLDELTQALSQRLGKLSEKIAGFSIASEFLADLKKTIVSFNEFAEKGKDEEFSRGEFNYDREWTTFPPTAPVRSGRPKTVKTIRCIR